MNDLLGKALLMRVRNAFLAEAKAETALHYALAMTEKSNDAGKRLAPTQGNLERAESYLECADELIISVSFSGNDTDVLAYWKHMNNVTEELKRVSSTEQKVKAITDFYVSLKADKEVMAYDKNLENEHEWDHLLNTWAHWRAASGEWEKAWRAWFDVDVVAGLLQ